MLHDGHPINVGFFRGAELADPDRLLEGTGKFMRHVKLRPERDVDVGSIRTIEKNGGVLENVVNGPGLNKPKHRYWIDPG